MIDLIEELTEVQAEAPDARIFFTVLYPSGSFHVDDITDPDRVSVYADQIRDGAATLHRISAYRDRKVVVERVYPREAGPVTDS